MKAGKRPLAIAALMLLAAIWGYNWVVMKLATRYAPPLDFAALRLLLGSAVLFGVMALRRERFRPAHPGAYAAIGIFQSGIFVALATWAVVTARAGTVSVLSYTMPIWVALLAWPLLHERLRVQQIVGLLVATAGIVLIVDLHGSGPLLWAEIVAVAAGVSWAIGVVLTKRLHVAQEPSLLALTTWQMFFGGIVAAIGAAALTHVHTTHWTMLYAGALAYNVLLASAAAYLLWIFALRTLSAREASIGTLANPIVGILAAWLQLGEQPSLREGAGMALVIVALSIFAFASSQQE